MCAHSIRFFLALAVIAASEAITVEAGVVTGRTPSAKTTTNTVWFGGSHWDAADARWEANLGGTWTFDSGIDNGWEGWISRDLTLLPPPALPLGNADDSDFRWTSDALYTLYGTPGTDLFPGTGDDGAIWCSKYEIEADELCYGNGQGYGDAWDHEARKAFAYGGSGDVRLTYRYFCASEKNYDFTYLYLEFNGIREAAPRVTFTGQLGGASAKRTQIVAVTAGSIPPNTTEITTVFRFVSDAWMSDETGSQNSIFGAFCCYNFFYEDLGTPANSDEDTFESDPEGWRFHQKPAIGNFVDLTPLTELPDPEVTCESLAGNVLTFFDKTAGVGDPLHPSGQLSAAISPVIDLAEAGLPAITDIDGWADAYADLPPNRAVAMRVWLRVYPVTCEATGLPIEKDIWWVDVHPAYTGTESPTCYLDEWFLGIPMQEMSFEYCRLKVEVIDWCWVSQCSDPGGNTTPWFDNLRVGVGYSQVVGADPQQDVPRVVQLASRPNPFAQSTTLDYAVPVTGSVRLQIFDTRGGLVRTLVDGIRRPGQYRASWDGRNAEGRTMGNGVYWARFETGGDAVTRMMVLLH